MPHDVKTQAFRSLQTLVVGGLPVSTMRLDDTASEMIEYCGESRHHSRPLIMTSINGQTLSLCAGDRHVYDAFRQADVIHCDGQPLVILSRLLARQPFPERVATTDLFPAVARKAALCGATFYLLGATATVNREAVARSRKAFPGLEIVGASHGYLSPSEEAAVVAEIASLKPDILWVSLGAPFEQDFCNRHRDALNGVGIIKTSGGLFDFLAGVKTRAPVWVQKLGFEWLYRLTLEPRRLCKRYLTTNPHALLIIAKTLR